jgi:hypothetical protein
MEPEKREGEAPAASGEALPPEAEAAVREFLKGFRRTFKMASFYSPDHPAFKTSVVDFFERLGGFLRSQAALTIGFASHALFFANRFWDDDRVFLELAQGVHIRKIKSLEFRAGITVDELTRFAARLTLPMKDYIKQGGIAAVLREERIVHIGAEEIDYSQLLRGEGEEIKDVWPYLLMEAVEQDDASKFEQLAQSFDKVASKFNTDDLIQNEELQRHFARFFRYLKETAVEKYRSCARGMLKSLLVVRKAPPETKFEQLKLILSDLSEQDLASTLWEEIIGDDKFDSLSFSVFAKIISKDRHKKIASSLHELFQTDQAVNRRAEVERKLKLLLSGTSGLLLSDVYRETLTSLLSEIPFEKKMELDPAELGGAYRWLLLNLLARDDGAEAEAAALGRLEEEWTAIVEGEDLGYVRPLWDVVDAKARRTADNTAFAGRRAALADFVEGLIMRGDASAELDAFIPLLGESRQPAAAYLAKVYADRIATPTLLRAALAFFPSFPADLIAGFEGGRSNVRLLERIADSLKGVDHPASLDILKALYRLGERRLRAPAVRAMSGLSRIDERFLFAALNEENDEVQGEALLILARGDRSRHVALAKLLNIQSPYGTRNRILIRHIRLVEARDVREARPFLAALAARKDFWNRRVRQEAVRVLEAWDEG